MAGTDRKTFAYDTLCSDILTVQIPPGSALDEVGLCDRFGLSRTPLREVLQRLAGRGYVEIEANKGAKVSSMNLSDLRVFFQTAPLVYCSVARMAAENHTAGQLADLRNIQAEFLAAISAGDATKTSLRNHAFHEKIGEMATNPYLMAALQRMLIDHTRLSQTFYRPASPAETVLVSKAGQQHDAMIAAIAAREADVAVDLTLQHWDLSRDRMERFVQPDPLPIDVISSKERRNAV